MLNKYIRYAKYMWYTVYTKKQSLLGTFACCGSMSNHQKQSLNKLEKAKATKEREVILNMRIFRGMELAAQGHVRKIVPSTTSATLYKVKSGKREDVEYNVIIESSGKIYCDCIDYQHRRITCKHVYAVVATEPDFAIVVADKAGHNFGEEEQTHEKVVYEP